MRLRFVGDGDHGFLEFELRNQLNMQALAIIKLAIGVSLATLLPPALAQGMFVFSNRIAGHEAPVFDTDCLTPLGRGFLAQAYVGDTPEGVAPLGEATPFIIGGYFREQSVYVAGVGDRQVHVQLRAWESAAGPTYEAAAEAGAKHGVSNTTTVWALASTGVTPDLTDDFRSFCLVPEPSASVLGIVGAVALLVSFRKSQFLSILDNR